MKFIIRRPGKATRGPEKKSAFGRFAQEMPENAAVLAIARFGQAFRSASCSLQLNFSFGHPEGQNGLDLLVQVVELPQQFIVPLVQFREQLEFISVFFHERPIFVVFPGQTAAIFGRFHHASAASREAFLENRPADLKLSRNGHPAVQLNQKLEKDFELFGQK
jgi:hypothetical protein